MLIPNLVLEWRSATKLCQSKIVQNTVLKNECNLLALNLYSISFSLLTTNVQKSFLFTCILLTRSNNQFQNYEFKFQNKIWSFRPSFTNFCLFGFSQGFVKIQNSELDAVSKMDEKNYIFSVLYISHFHRSVIGSLNHATHSCLNIRH